MMARRGVLGLLTGGAAALLGGCNSRKTLRYKMTVEVNTPDGVRSGHAVREVVHYSSGNLLSFGDGAPKPALAAGEAVVVDLLNNQMLFALLTGEDGDVDYAAQLPANKLGWAKDKSLTHSPVVIWPHPPVPPKQQWLYAYPMLVRFKDLNDPKSIERVDKENLAATFGPGYSLKRIVVEVTDEPTTSNIGRRLGWLDRLENYRSEPNNPFTSTLPREVSGLRNK